MFSPKVTTLSLIEILDGKEATVATPPVTDKVKSDTSKAPFPPVAL